MNPTEQQRLVLREYLKHGGMVNSASYLPEDAESARDSEYGIEVVVITGGTVLRATFPMAGIMKAAAKKLLGKR